MSEDTFESFVHQVLLKRYPTANIKRVDGSGGDEGIDCFEGELSGNLAIWQAKHFTGRLGSTQKRQILDSINVAFKYRRPSSWTLCIPIDLRTQEHQWFQQAICKRFSRECTIELIQSSDLVADVSRSRELSLVFFPDTGIANLLKLEDRFSELRNLAQEPSLFQLRVEQFLAQMNSLDTRLGVTIVSSTGSSIPHSIIPESVFAVNYGAMALYISPRDLPSLARNPVVITMTVTADVSRGIEEAFNVGDSIRLPPGSVVGFSSSSPLIQHFLPLDMREVSVDASPVASNPLARQHFRLVSGIGEDRREIPFLRCKETKTGTKEFTLQGQIPGLDIAIRIIRQTKTLYINFSSRFQDVDVFRVESALSFLYALEKTGVLEIYNLESDDLIYRQACSTMASVDRTFGLTPSFKQTLQDSLVVSKRFELPLRMPPYVGGEESQNLRLLANIASDGVCEGVTLSTTVMKCKSSFRELVAIASKGSFKVALRQSERERLTMFGKS